MRTGADSITGHTCCPCCCPNDRYFAVCVAERRHKNGLAYRTDLCRRAGSLRTGCVTKRRSQNRRTHRTDLCRRTGSIRAGRMTKRIHRLLCDKNRTANRAVLALGKTRCRTGRCYRAVRDFVMTECFYSILFRNATTCARMARYAVPRTGSRCHDRGCAPRVTECRQHVTVNRMTTILTRAVTGRS